MCVKAKVQKYASKRDLAQKWPVVLSARIVAGVKVTHSFSWVVKLVCAQLILKGLSN